MRITRWLLVSFSVLAIAACTHKNNQNPKPTCGDGLDPASPECNKPQCSDGIDNDGDGLIDYPNDPGCFAPNQDSEVDDCPDGPNCPECGNHKDDDNNGFTDFAGGDPGCYAASDTDEYTEDPTACGPDATIQHLPFGNEAMGMLASGGNSHLVSPHCGGSGSVVVYELRVKAPKVIVASTDNAGTTVDTVLSLRSAACAASTSEVTCNDDVSPTDNKSTITVAVMPGTYYLIVAAHDSGASGAYDLTVHFFVGEGIACQTGDDCGPGLVCRVVQGGTMKVCAKHECSDGVDNDGDGLIDYPNDPGCASPLGDDETDDCPNALNGQHLGPNCPECGNKLDDNANGKTDYPIETNCVAASSTTEWCLRHSPVAKVTAAMTMGNTTGLVSDYDATCAFQTGVPDLTYRLDLPALDSFHADLNTGGTWFGELALLDHTCGGTALACSNTIDQLNLTAQTYFLVVDGDSSTDFGMFTLDVSGKIKAGASCESALAQSGALTCGLGYACKGAVGSRTCQHAQCSDGIDNNGDGKIDYPNDPGCTDPGDDTEDTVCPGAMCPVCSNGLDDNANGLTDWPAEWGCTAAGGATEVFCMPDTNAATKITTKTTTGTTTGKSFDMMLKPSCSSFATSPEMVYALQLPVPVVSLQVDTIGSMFDTVLAMRDANCLAEVPAACNDDIGGGVLQSQIVLSNLGAGGYAIIVDGFSAASGAYTLNVHGTVAVNTPCSSPLFSGGTAAVLSCPTGKTCTGTPLKCQ